jgi:hypothetical protein
MPEWRRVRRPSAGIWLTRPTLQIRSGTSLAAAFAFAVNAGRAEEPLFLAAPHYSGAGAGPARLSRPRTTAAGSDCAWLPKK